MAAEPPTGGGTVAPPTGVEAAAPAAPTRRARETAIVSLGQATTMVTGGVLALLIAHILGKSAKSDAFFAAYGVAAVAIGFGQTFRFTALPRLADDPDGGATERLLAAVCVIALAAAVPMVVLAGPVGSLLVAHDPDGVAADSLRLLWIAVAGQLLGSMLAAILAMRGGFVAIGSGYVATGIVSVVAFLALEPLLGVYGVSVGLDIAAVLLSAVLATALLRSGWTPDWTGALRRRPVAAELRHLVVASATYVAMNVGYVICVAVASRGGTGEPTLYAYAYFTAAILVAVTAASAAMVQTPELLSRARTAESTEASTLATYRVTLVVVLPLLALALLVGSPLASFVLGGSFDRADTTRLVIALVCLSGWVFGVAGGIFAVVELIARGRTSTLAWIAAAQIAALAGLAILGRELWGIRGIALGQSISMLAATGAQLWLTFGAGWLRVVGRLVLATLRGALAVAIAFAPSAAIVAAEGDSAGVLVGAAALALALTAAASRLVWPQEWRLLGSVVSR
ncbi:MAG: hypothetical protein IRZ21_02940 [Thermoleophilaceae bacterium]|nr:hypothetical protein [Thermoleophilaceae bacterium]